MGGRSFCNFHFHPRSTVFLVLCYAILLHHCCLFCEAAAVTDPNEVEALRIIASKMGNTKWNFSVDPCSCDRSWYTIDNVDGDLGVICNCAFNKNTICHVLSIKVLYEEMAGVIPPELANLTYLENLDFRNNLLHGSIPASLGSLTGLQYLSFGTNNLSGEIPREFGKLTNLISLSFDQNHLSGTIPPELGNLTNLEKIYIVSNRFSGEIPTTFANLKKMKTFWASRNNFTGKIPDFIGNYWSQLESLKFEGTSFEGPIPSSISNLTQLTELTLCDIPQGGTFLLFLQNLTNLKTLILRNDMISGTIPEYIGEWGQLSVLDLSYNNFSGVVPTWLLDQNLNVNLVGNFLQENGKNNQRALTCLQRHFPCHKGNPKSSSLAINCGGPQLIDSSTQVLFVGDDETLDAASFYMNSEENWGVSTTGIFWNSSNSSNEITNPYMIEAGSVLGPIQDPSIYTTARLSPSSLRYYGLGLQNGPYRVELHFKEIQIPDTQSWRSLGSRIFDVYLQGVQVLKDFNIKEVAGLPNGPVVQNYTVNVTENLLEVHFFSADKGTCCIPSIQTHGPLISAIRVTPRFKSTIGNKSSNKRGRTNIVGILLGVLIGLGIVLCSNTLMNYDL